MTTAKLYYSFNNRSYQQIKKELIKTNTKFQVQSLNESPIEWEQLLEILMYTDNGIEDLLSVKSIDYKEMISQGVDFDEMTLTEFHRLVVKHPRLMRSPILVVKNTTLIGYNAEEMSILESRADRIKRHMEMLNNLRRNETFEYDIITA